MPLFFFFILLPILELVVFIKVGAKIGAGGHRLDFLSSILGMMVLRVQGFITLASMRSRLQQARYLRVSWRRVCFWAWRVCC